MHKSIKIIFVLILLLYSLSAIALPASAVSNGYSVKTVAPEVITDTHPNMAVPIDASEVPPLILLMALALSVTPVVAFPFELFLFFKMFSYLGYWKISKSRVFDNAARRLIYSCIQDNPGINFNAIVQMTGIKSGTLQYHLFILQTREKISVFTRKGHSRYFENSGHFSDREKTLLSFIRNDTDNRILTLLLINPDISWKDLRDSLGKPGSMITWYINRMRDAGIICLKKTGKHVRYEIDPEMRQYLKRYLVCHENILSEIQ